MAIVNKFNVNKQEVALDPDIIENMSANDVSYNASTQYDENTVGDKLNKLSKLEQSINVIRPDLLSSFNLIDPNRLIIGQFITTNGSITPNQELFMSEFIDMLGITQVYSNFHSVGINLYAYSEDFSFISKVNVTPPRTYTLPENTRYIRISGAVKYTSNLFLYTEENSKYYAYGITKGMIHSDNNDVVINGTIDDLRKEVRTIKTSNQYINKINYMTDWIDGYIIVNGNMQTNNNGCVTNFIDVFGLEVIYSNAGSNGGVLGYDEDKNFVKALSSISGNVNIEEGIRYIRLNFNNKNNKVSVFLYTNADYVNLSNVPMSTIYTYGITYSDVEQSKLLEPIPEKLDKFHTAYINSLKQFTTDIVEKENAIINSTGQIVENPNTVGKFYSKYIPVVGGKIISSNIQANGGMFAYDKNKEFLGPITGWKTDYTIFENYISTNIVPDNCAFIRVVGLMSGYNTHVLYVGNEVVYKKYDFGETFDSHFKYRNKKLVTIGDSITYQTSWQRRLCELTGMRWNRKEVRGTDESVKTEGYGYILLDSSLGDTDTYYESVEGITKTEETIVDGFEYAHPIWTDESGNKYRQPCRMAEGGETVMPVKTTSIYSRASDSKYYKGDVIIVFAGANDKVGYINKYPTYGDLSTIQGVTNLKTDSEDTTEATFEIYTDDRILEVVGDYSDVNDVTGIKKYNYTFRACFRGLLKKVVDANPEAQIIVIGPFATMIKGNEYISRGYDYLTKVENEVIAECAREFSCQYIDLMPLFGRYNADRYFLGYDGTVYIHPIKAGGNKIAEYIASMM